MYYKNERCINTLTFAFTFFLSLVPNFTAMGQGLTVYIALSLLTELIEVQYSIDDVTEQRPSVRAANSADSMTGYYRANE